MTNSTVLLSAAADERFNAELNIVVNVVKDMYHRYPKQGEVTGELEAFLRCLAEAVETGNFSDFEPASTRGNDHDRRARR